MHTHAEVDSDKPTPDLIRESKRLAAASRELVRSAQSHIDTAARRLDRARNLLQACVLLRALAQQQRGRSSSTSD